MPQLPSQNVWFERDAARSMSQGIGIRERDRPRPRIDKSASKSYWEGALAARRRIWRRDSRWSSM